MEKLRKNMPLIIAFAGLLFAPYKMVPDNYYFIPTGAEILANGFPHEDFLSMHEGMHLVVPQWLFTVIFSLMYSWCGIDGAYALSIGAAAVQIYMIYRLFLISSSNRSLSIGATAIAGTLMMSYFSPRPWVISNTILISGIILLEKYIRTGERKWLCGLPLLSLLLINIHASVFPLFLAVTSIFFLASVIENTDSYRTKIGKLFQTCGEHRAGWKPPAAALVSALAAAFINPYGYEAVIYGAVGVMDTSAAGGHVFLPVEMSLLTVQNGIAILIYMAFAVAVISRCKVPFRYAVMFAVSAVMTLLMYRNMFMLMTLGSMCVMYSMRQLKVFEDFPANVKNPWQLAAALSVAAIAVCLLREMFFPVEETAFPWVYSLVVVLLMIAFFAAMHKEGRKHLLLRAAIAIPVCLVAVCMRYGESYSVEDYSAYVSKPALDYIESHEENPASVRIWCSAVLGSYAESRGMKPFYDSRVELFAKSLNGKGDYRSEYELVELGFLDYMPVFSKYGIDYVLAQSEEGSSYYRLAQDDRFELLVDTPQIRLYKHRS